MSEALRNVSVFELSSKLGQTSGHSLGPGNAPASKRQETAGPLAVAEPQSASTGQVEAILSPPGLADTPGTSACKVPNLIAKPFRNRIRKNNRASCAQPYLKIQNP